MDGVVDGPAGDDGVVAGGGHDVEYVGLFQLEPPALAEAVGRIRGHPAERNPVGDGLADHGLGHAHFRLEGDAVVDACPPASLAVVRP